MNPMKEIRIEKITLNIGVGQAGEKLEKAAKLLQNLADAKVVQTKSKKRIPGWGLRIGLPIGCKVTLRGKKAEEMLSRLLVAIDKRIALQKFTNETISFGIPEYIDTPGAKYDVDVGIIGLECSVTLERRGYRVKKRAIRTTRVGKTHKITSEDAINYMKNKFGVTVE